MPRTKKVVPKGEYRNLEVRKGVYFFEVKLKDNTWYMLGGLSGETSEEDAKKFAQTTAESWRKK